MIGSKAEAQLKPGFDKEEYHEMLRVCAQIVGTPATDARKDLKPLYHTLAYRSDVTALDNRWDLWVHKKWQKCGNKPAGHYAEVGKLAGKFLCSYGAGPGKTILIS
jgi:hypothetical protein